MILAKYESLPDEFYVSPELVDLPVVGRIIDEVKKRGDSAVIEYTKQFDGLSRRDFEISPEEISQAYENVGEKTVKILREASANIERFAKLQYSMFRDIESNENGYTYGQKVIPLGSVGCYVPGGRYPLPSSALMTVIPAKIAGVENIIVCSPKIADQTIVAADIAGATKIYSVGGAQAIAAMAFGTETVPRVDKIVGPGNKYVTAAKREVFGHVGIDFLAGPSEVVIIADDTADPEIIAADLLAQAEHDPNSRSDLITTSKLLADEVLVALENQLEKLKTRNIAEISISNSYIILVDNIKQAIEICNQRGPEHLELQINQPDNIVKMLNNYGSLFIGQFSAEVFGDYCSGPNHSLPTNGVARYTGGLSVKEYLKIVTYQKLEKNSMRPLIEVASHLAEIEGLDGHKQAAQIRRKFLD